MDNDEYMELKEKLEKLEEEFREYRKEEQRKENQRLRTALIGAGGIIVALGGFVWWEIIWPVISSGRK